MMTSVLVSPDGQIEYEAAHGTVTRHYYRYLKGESTSTNPDGDPVCLDRSVAQAGRDGRFGRSGAFANRLQAASLAVIEAGVVTGDLKNLVRLRDVRNGDTLIFLAAALPP